MAKIRERNHFISRFLLRRFASRVDAKRKKSWIWELQRTGVREISTKDAAVGSKFYGERATGIEDAFSVQEGEFGAALREIDAGSPINKHSATLDRFVWSQTVRTRALRQTLRETMTELFSQFTNSLDTNAAMDAFKRMAREELPRTIAEELEKLPPDVRREAERRLDQMGGVAGAEQFAFAKLDTIDFGTLGAALNAYVNSNGFMDQALERGHVRGLSKLLSDPPSEKDFRADAWHLLDDPAGSLVLGDVGAFAVTHDGKTSLLMRISNSWREVYLPISPTKALVACKGDAQPTLSSDGVNDASASFSLASVYAPRVTERTRSLIPSIGTRARMNDSDELSSVVDEVWGQKPRK